MGVGLRIVVVVTGEVGRVGGKSEKKIQSHYKDISGFNVRAAFAIQSCATRP